MSILTAIHMMVDRSTSILIHILMSTLMSMNTVTDMIMTTTTLMTTSIHMTMSILMNTVIHMRTAALIPQRSSLLSLTTCTITMFITQRNLLT